MADPATISSWHAHVYFDTGSTAAATALREDVARLFPAALIGRWWDRPVGPHPQSMFQIAFPAQDFARLVPWLALNRGELAILVHPNSGDEFADHAHHALWLGAILPLDLGKLRRPMPDQPASSG